MSRKTTISNCFKLCVMLCGLLILASCNRQVLFTQNKPLDAKAGIAADKSEDKKQEKILAPDDKIMISIWDHDELSVGSLQGTYSLAEEFGKWIMIDVNGEVHLPQVGSVKVGGLTVKEATAYLEKIYAKFIQLPVINLRVLNNQVTILGEVRSPGVYLFSADQVRLADLIGKAQGFTDYAKTRKIKIIRDTNQMTVDFTNATSVSAKEFVIYPGDVIYIPPTGGKAWERFSTKLIPIASLITAIALVYSVSNNNN
ncbi:MAG: polysaccharide biosynthesis/export family protein [Bacteroidota bacterium]